MNSESLPTYDHERFTFFLLRKIEMSNFCVYAQNRDTQKIIIKSLKWVLESQFSLVTIKLWTSFKHGSINLIKIL